MKNSGKQWLCQAMARQAGVTLVLGLLMTTTLPVVAATGDGYGAYRQIFPARTYVAQSLPPLQGSGYPSYNSYGQNNQNYGQSYQQYQQPSYQQAPLQGYVSTAPAGTMVNASFSSPLSSEFARVGDRFVATLGSPIAAGSSVLLPAGSQLEGQVVMVKPAGRTGRNGELDIRFTSALTPTGQRIPLSARVQTEDGTGVISGGSTKGRLGRAALNTGVGAGLGAALGTAMGPLSGGEVGRGAIYGTAIGGGIGALKSAWNKGKEAVLESGQPVNIVLDQPLTVSPAPSNPAPSYNQQPYSNQYDQNSGYQNFQPYGQSPPNFYGQ